MKKQKQDLEKTYREKERELVKEGKTPYFLKKCKFLSCKAVKQPNHAYNLKVKVADFEILYQFFFFFKAPVFQND